MAWAAYDPITQAKVTRRQTLQTAANSADPLTRYQAKERIFYEGLQSVGRELTQQAIANGKAMQEAEKIYERSENSKYKPLHR